MRRPRTIPFVMWLVLGALSLVPVAAADEPDGKDDPYKSKIMGLPFIYYSPETKLAFWVGDVYNFSAGQHKEKTRTSSVCTYANYILYLGFGAWNLGFRGVAGKEKTLEEEERSDR